MEKYFWFNDTHVVNAKADLLAIWRPEGVWVSFIDEVIEKRMAKQFDI